MTADIHVYPQYPIQPFGAVLREMGYPPIGRRGRGQEVASTCWGHMAIFAARTGMMRHSPADFDYIQDCFFASYKHTTALTRVPDALRTTFRLLRKALVYGIRVIDASGRV